MPDGSTYKKALRAMQTPEDSITLLVGPPGVGKTRAAIEAALNKGMQIAVVRPPVSFGKGYGYLPGELENKVDPWMVNIKGILADLDIMPERAIKDGTVFFPSFEHLQGDTFHNCFIILDEAENCTRKELYVCMTRVGRKSRMAICGDFNQVSETQKNSGLPFLEKAMSNTHLKTMNYIDFTGAKCYRSELCGNVTEMFNEWS